jgi:hypothetical protein
VRHWRVGLLIAFYLALIVGGALAGHRLTGLVAIDVRPINEPEVHTMIMATTGLYVLASAVPFVPGAEIGLGLILILGPSIVFLVYVGMVLALVLAYLVGRLVPARACAAAFGFFGLERARRLVQQMAPLDTRARLALLSAGAPSRIVPFLLRHRFLALALAFNLPGNTLLGGGGGIALAAGMSGLFPLVAYLATVALAVAPLPLLILLTGGPP